MLDEERNYVDGLYLVPVLNRLNPALFQEINLSLGFFLLARKDEEIYSTQLVQKEDKLQRETPNPRERYIRYIDSSKQDSNIQMFKYPIKQ